VENKMNTPSGLYLPNKIPRFTFIALAEIMGANGMISVLKMANLPEFIKAPPADDMERAFDFADYAALCTAIENTYGPRGAKVLLARAGRVAFQRGIGDFVDRLGVAGNAIQYIPLGIKAPLFLKAIAKNYTDLSDRTSESHEEGDHYIFTNLKCPVCWGRKMAKPACHITYGFVQEAMRWISGGKEFAVIQTSSVGSGGPNCSFQINKHPIES
jgi:predicted hydrocarbon binding protein